MLKFHGNLFVNSWHSIYAELKPVFSYFLLSRMLIVLSAVIGSAVLGTRTPKSGETLWNIQVPFFNLFARWDSAFYIGIAKNGYIQDSQWSFRPLFPLVLRVLSLPLSTFMYIDISVAIVGFLVNNLFFLAALVFTYKATRLMFSDEVASITVCLIAFYPASVFFSAIYSESLYILITSLCIYAVESNRHLRSGILGFLAGLTRPEGFLLSLPLFIKYLTSKEKMKSLVSSIMAASSLVVMFVIAQVMTGNYRVLFSVPLGWNKLALSDIISDISNIKYLFVMPDFISFGTISVPTVSLGIVALVAFFTQSGFSSLKGKREFPYYIYLAVLMLVYVAVGDVRSIPRYFSTLLPMYWTFSAWTIRIKSMKRFLPIIFSILLIFGTVLFTNWYHFL